MDIFEKRGACFSCPATATTGMPAPSTCITGTTFTATDLAVNGAPVQVNGVTIQLTLSLPPRFRVINCNEDDATIKITSTGGPEDIDGGELELEAGQSYDQYQIPDPRPMGTYIIEVTVEGTAAAPSPSVDDITAPAAGGGAVATLNAGGVQARCTLTGTTLTCDGVNATTAPIELFFVNNDAPSSSGCIVLAAAANAEVAIPNVTEGDDILLEVTPGGTC